MTRAAALGWSVFALALALAIVAVGPVKGGGAVAGGILAIVVAQLPIVGLTLSMFANTCFQVLGSAHIVGLPLSLTKIFGALTLGGFLVQFALKRWRLASSAQMAGVVPLALVVVVWTFALDPAGVAMRGLGQFAQTFLLFFLVVNIAGRSERWFEITLWALVLGLAGSGVIAILEHNLTSLQVADDDSRLTEGTVGAILDTESLTGVVIKRVTGGMGDANWFAYSIAAGLPLCLYLWLAYDRLLARVVSGAAAALMLVGLVYSFTRTGFLGLGVATAYLLVRRTLPVVPVMAGALAMLVVALFYVPEGFVDRFFSRKYLEEGSTPLRRDLVRSAFAIFLESPVVGHGYGQFGNEYVEILKTRPSRTLSANVSDWALSVMRDVDAGREDPTNLGTHNMPLEIGVEFGLVGLAAYGIWLISFWRDTAFVSQWGPPRYRLLAICLQAALLGLLMCSLLAHMKFLKILWLVAAFAGALAWLVRRLADDGERAGPKTGGS